MEEVSGAEEGSQGFPVVLLSNFVHSFCLLSQGTFTDIHPSVKPLKCQFCARGVLFVPLLDINA